MFHAAEGSERGRDRMLRGDSCVSASAIARQKAESQSLAASLPPRASSEPPAKLQQRGERHTHGRGPGDRRGCTEATRPKPGGQHHWKDHGHTHSWPLPIHVNPAHSGRSRRKPWSLASDCPSSTRISRALGGLAPLHPSHFPMGWSPGLRRPGHRGGTQLSPGNRGHFF